MCLNVLLVQRSNMEAILGQDEFCERECYPHSVLAFLHRISKRKTPNFRIANSFHLYSAIYNRRTIFHSTDGSFR